MPNAALATKITSELSDNEPSILPRHKITIDKCSKIKNLKYGLNNTFSGNLPKIFKNYLNLIGY